MQAIPRNRLRNLGSLSICHRLPSSPYRHRRRFLYSKKKRISGGTALISSAKVRLEVRIQRQTSLCFARCLFVLIVDPTSCSYSEPESYKDACTLQSRPRIPDEPGSARLWLAPEPNPLLRFRPRWLLRRRTRPPVVAFATRSGSPRLARLRVGSAPLASDVVYSGGDKGVPRVPRARGTVDRDSQLAQRFPVGQGGQTPRRSRPRRHAQRNGRMARHHAVRLFRLNFQPPFLPTDPII